jgi:hypothetical protein
MSDSFPIRRVSISECTGESDLFGVRVHKNCRLKTAKVELKAYSKMGSDEVAIGAATGVSGGAAFTIPSLFLTAFKDQPNPFSRLIDPKLMDSEQVDGEDCYVISGSSSVSKNETYWISKTSHLIKKYSRSLERPEGPMKMPDLTDQQLDQVIKSMGQDVTDANRQKMRQMMKNAQESVQNVKLKGTSTESQTKIDSADLKDDDFTFKPPADATLKDSLFGAALNAQK